MDSDDDWLETSAAHPGAPGDPLVDRQWERLTTRYADAGYREGITEGKLSTLQQGFDASFSASVPASRKLGNLRGRTAALISFLVSATQPRAAPDLLFRARELKAQLGRVSRTDVLQKDEEALAHARDEHPNPEEEVAAGVMDAGGWGLRAEDGERREMESVLHGLEGLGGSKQTGMREWELLRAFEGMVSALEEEAGL